MNASLLTFTALAAFFGTAAQLPAPVYHIRHKGYSGSYAASTCETHDGGSFWLGTTIDNKEPDFHSNTRCELDILLVKLDNKGNVQWKKCYGGGKCDWHTKVLITKLNTYIIAGTTNSEDQQVSGLHGENDVLLMEVDINGTIIRQKCIGGSGFESISDVALTQDGGLVIAGATESSDGDVAGIAKEDAWLFRVNQQWQLQWQLSLGGAAGSDKVSAVKALKNGDFVVCGLSNSTDLNGYNGVADFYAARVSGTGSLLWQRCFGGSQVDYGFGVGELSDGSLLFTGRTNSNDGDVTKKVMAVPDQMDAWVVKTTSSGVKLWDKCFGGSGNDHANDAMQTQSGDVYILAEAESTDGDVVGMKGMYSDTWLLKIDPQQGTILSQACYAFHNAWNQPGQFSETTDHALLIGGVTNGTDGYSGNLSAIKIQAAPSTVGLFESSHPSFSVFPNPGSGVFKISAENRGASHVCILNCNGQVVAETKTDAGNITMDLTLLPDGIYFAEVRGAENVSRSKLIIRH